MIPNGGSAQAGQVEGPTAVPITGEGAIFAPPAIEASLAPDAAAAPSVEDAAAFEAIGSLVTSVVRDAEGDVRANASEAVSGDDASEEVGSDEDASPQEGSPPVTAPDAVVAGITTAPLPTPSIRTIGGPGYDLDIPADWENLDPTGLGSFLITSAHRSMEPTDDFLTNVIVSAEPFPGDAKAYAMLNVPALVDAGCLLRDSQPSSAGGRAAVDVEALWLNITGVPYVTLQRHVTTGQVGYVITCAAAETAFESKRDTCLDILDSFR